MGSGSRIDHQHHLVATTVGALTISAPRPMSSHTDGTVEDIRARIWELTRKSYEGTSTPQEDDECWDLIDRLQVHVREQADTDDDYRAMWQEIRDRTIFGPHRRDLMSSDGPPAIALPVQRAAAQQVLGEALAEHQAARTISVQARDRWPASEVSYEEDFNEFRRVYEAAQERAIWGEQAVPFLLEDATGGLGARVGGRGFGLEIEFDTDGDWDDRDEALRAIGRDLYDAGLARDRYQHSYHSQEDAGYTDAPNAWRLEEDCTVAGEIVSPILYDERETWQNLATVCEIVQRHGGGAGPQTGGHIHVGLHDYDHDVANHNRLMRMYGEYEDVLFRLASNPNAPASEHRGTEWCSPNSVPADGYRSLADVASRARRGYALNLSAARGERGDHGEFRLWDGSVDPAVIQSQVNLSLGMAAAAVRNGPSPVRRNTSMRLGSHREQLRQWGVGPGDNLGPDALEPNSLSFRRLVDEIFHRRQEREQAASLFAITRWQHNNI
jgi:hypothetical protein